VEIGEVASDNRAAWRLFIHHTVPAIATAATASNPAIWTRTDPFGARGSAIHLFSAKTPVLFRVLPLCP
jgi:hypothetical protein